MKRTTEKKIARTMMMTQGLIARYEAEAERRGWSKGLVIREALDRGLEEIAAEEAPRHTSIETKIHKQEEKWHGVVFVDGSEVWQGWCPDRIDLVEAIGQEIADHI